ncbi:MAG: dihydrofolate reductase [Dehalococcoidia bacterium]|nr:MAG: dihydrofolate reductase [Dehalococcoidia bacterium]
MPRLAVFNSISLDGYFTDSRGDMSWAHSSDPEWNEFVAGNASGDGTLVFGRVTYEMMAAYWPTPLAMQNNPDVAQGMNRRRKIVFSRTLGEASWSNTQLVKDDLAATIRRLKAEPGPDMAVLGSGSIVAQLAQEGLIDGYQVALKPIVLGAGRTMFEGVTRRLDLRLTRSHAFTNGSVVLWYEPAG